MQMTVLEALRAAMAHELENDPDVIVLGEDVGTAGGIFRVTIRRWMRKASSVMRSGSPSSA
jgi:pyruvate/2-oxoglutarate/acetoin dehydrogenase E1 component